MYNPPSLLAHVKWQFTSVGWSLFHSLKLVAVRKPIYFPGVNNLYMEWNDTIFLSQKWLMTDGGQPQFTFNALVYAHAGLNIRVGYHSTAIMHTGICCIATRVQLLHAIHGQTAHIKNCLQLTKWRWCLDDCFRSWLAHQPHLMLIGYIRV